MAGRFRREGVIEYLLEKYGVGSSLICFINEKLEFLVGVFGTHQHVTYCSTVAHLIIRFQKLKYGV